MVPGDWDYLSAMLTVTHLSIAPGRPVTAALSLSPKTTPPARPFVSTLHYYGIPPPPRISWLAVVLSAGLHAGLIFGFSHKAPPPKRFVFDDTPSAMLMMPDLNESEDDKPKELNDDEPIEAPSVAVPMLADIPVLVPTDAAFTQLRDLTIPAKIEGAANSVIAIPLHIQRGRPDTSAIKDLFNIADLDRKPEPIVQTSPVFPYALKAEITDADVRVGFIVTSRGDVIMPYIISSTHPGFERPALEAVAKWKFKPGMRGGRKVNTRVVQPINFNVSEGK